MCDFGITEGLTIAAVSSYASIASAVVGVAGAITSYEGQVEATDAQNKATAAYTMAQSKNIVQGTDNNYAQTNQQALAVSLSASQKMTQEQLATRSATATANASAGEAGVGGLSVSALSNEYANNNANYDANVTENQTLSDNQLTEQMLGFEAQGDSQLSQLQTHMILPTPNIGAPLVGIGTAVGGYVDRSAKANANTVNPAAPQTSNFTSYGPQYSGDDAPF